MSIPAKIKLFKEGKCVDTVFASASYGTATGFEHLKHWLPHFLERFPKDYFDGMESSLDGNRYYLTGEGMLANEVIKE